MKHLLILVLLALAAVMFTTETVKAQSVIDVPDVFKEIFAEDFIFPAEQYPLISVVEDEGVKPVEGQNNILMSQACCKYCCKGKPCGNSCISRRYTCHQPEGCACAGC